MVTVQDILSLAKEINSAITQAAENDEDLLFFGQSVVTAAEAVERLGEGGKNAEQVKSFGKFLIGMHQWVQTINSQNTAKSLVGAESNKEQLLRCRTKFIETLNVFQLTYLINWRLTAGEAEFKQNTAYELDQISKTLIQLLQTLSEHRKQTGQMYGPQLLTDSSPEEFFQDIPEDYTFQMDVAFSTTNGIEGYPKVENCAWTKITAEQLSALTAIKIGEGSFSVVYKATYQGKAVALKVSRRPLQTKQEFDAIKSEIDLWKSLSDHDNVVELHGACLSTMHPYVVMPYYEKGSIATYLRKNPDVPMVSRVKWMLDIAKGLTHLHQNDIRCGDLRLDNVMLTDKLFAVISDFGLTAFKKNGRTSNVWTSSRVMSEAYRCIAPEKNDHKLLNSKTYDIFCYGMTCYHLITGSTPFQIESNLDILRGMIIEGRFPMKPENSQIPEQIWANFQSCFTTDLDRRPTAADLSNGFDGFLRWHSLHPQPAAAPNRESKATTPPFSRDQPDSKYNSKEFQQEDANMAPNTLHEAAKCGNNVWCSDFLKHVDVDDKDTDGNTALHYAAMEGHVDTVKLLLGHDANRHIQNHDDLTPTDLAMMHSRKNVLPLLTEMAGNDKAAKLLCFLDMWKNVDKMKRNVLKCCQAREWKKCNSLIQQLLQLKVSLRGIVDQNGWTPLHFAAIYGHFETCSLLIQGEANPKAKNDIEDTALHLAAVKGFLRICILLIYHGAVVQVKNKFLSTPLLLAASKGHLAVCKLLLEKGANPNATNKDGNTVLYEAIRIQHLRLTSLLLQHGADPNQAFLDGRRPLHEAAANNDRNLCMILLEHGADVNLHAGNGNCPIHEAVIKSDFEICKLLLENRANPNAEDFFQNTPLHLAAKADSAKLCGLLVQHGAFVRMRNVSGELPSHFAKRGSQLYDYLSSNEQDPEMN